MGREINRRGFLRKYLLGSELKSEVPFTGIGPGGRMLDEDGTLARLRGYRHDALEVDTRQFPGRKGAQGEVQYCFNCQFYTGGTDDARAACDKFPGREVSGRGWCNTWSQDQG